MREIIFILLFVICFTKNATQYSTCCPPPKQVAIPKYVTIHIPEYFSIFNLKPVEKVKSCPKDFLKQGNACIKITKTEGACPLGFSRISDQECQKVLTLQEETQVQDLLCPQGYIQQGPFRCVKVLNCPKSFELVGNECKRKEIKCPKGSVRVGRSCIYNAFKCPAGFIMKNQKCLKEVAFCPKGYTFVAGKCKRTTDCKKGFTLENGICVLIKIRCPKGQKLVNGACKETLTSDKECPKGYTSVNGSCKRVIIDCPYGTAFDGKLCKSNSCTCKNDFSPVCGVDGITYKNECEANCLKVQISYNSACSCSKTCPSYYSPVCGSDNIVYQNACHARINGVSMIKGSC